MDPAGVAAVAPARPALVLHPGGDAVSYAELDDRSRRLAHVLAAAGARQGACVALLLPADVHWAEVVWAGLRTGLHVAALDAHLTPSELAPQLLEAAPVAVVTSTALLPRLRTALSRTPLEPDVLAVGGGAGARDLDREVDAADAGPLERETTGARLLFSSGTTGRPRAHRQSTSPEHPSRAPLRLAPLLSRLGLGGEDVLLSAGPPHHAAPFAFTSALQQRGATVVQLERFDARGALAALERHRCTASQWVPTMFSRLLALDPTVRRGADLSAHRAAVHSGAPCPVDLKRRMIAEWGPVVHEYYGASEGFGHTVALAHEWLERPGTVGRALVGRLHVTDDDGRELPPGEVGLVWFERPGAGPAPAPDLRAEPPSARVHPRGWRTAGDLGSLDADGWLWLVGRAGHTVVTGGVNVSPQEVEDVLRDHPAVLDAAVLGAPDPEFGQRVRALLQLADGVVADAALADDLLAHCRLRLAGPKLPRVLDVVADLPRTASGKTRRTGLEDTPVLVALPTAARPVPAPSSPAGGPA